jgi:hypothetical protein
MKYTILPRGKGKSISLITQSAEHGWYIVAHNQAETDRLLMQAKQLGYVIPQPITYDEFLQSQWQVKGIRGFLIDDADLLLQRLGKGVEIKGISLTSEEGE